MKTIDTVTLDSWLREGRDFVLVDTLPGPAYAAGHLPGAINLVSDDVFGAAPNRLPNRDRTIVVYCASARCKRAGLSAERLESLGYTQVVHYAGGKRDWVDSGHLLEKETESSA